ncbi:MgtC/SapB family protein [Paraburkholderia sartisoli]|uniref:Protein MgtC n=1 Tax=Paraburkholderia sartisoli TaxID=83784 RepID=A0A1H4H185_9BURK|nr:MgtC/SapB family protein [Paraburkholderia sartisoli]SEB15553.1 putative Mg2+ transporter-C (MgtC) family protein [Paraburkholderia sartisoli]
MLPASTLYEVILRMAVAVVIGGIVGLDRNLHGKPTGIKTLGLVSLGSCLATMASMGFVVNGVAADVNAARVIQGIVTGIGFLGAGVIVQNPARDKIRGLTTAASIWVTAALGIVCGTGAWSVALAALVLLFALLFVGRFIEKPLYRFWMRRPERERDEITATDD